MHCIAANDVITVTVNDADATAVTASNLSALGGKTAGTVTVTNAVAITGDHDQLTAALVTAGSKVEVSDVTVTISDADATAITAAELSNRWLNHWHRYRHKCRGNHG